MGARISCSHETHCCGQHRGATASSRQWVKQEAHPNEVDDAGIAVDFTDSITYSSRQPDETDAREASPCSKAGDLGTPEAEAGVRPTERDAVPSAVRPGSGFIVFEPPAAITSDDGIPGLERQSSKSSNASDSSECSYLSSCASMSGASSNHFRGERRHKASRLLVTHTMGLQPSNALQLIIESTDDIQTHYKLATKVLGKGAFGVVRKARLKVTGAVRAVKAIDKDRMLTRHHLIRGEIDIMKQLDHPNLLMLYEVMEDPRFLYLVLELCSGGSLEDHMRHGPLPEPVAAICMQQIVRATYYLHKHWICHRDLKADNCLIGCAGPLKQATLKVADFGLSCRFEAGKMLTSAVGTPTHMAPEVLAKKYKESCDMWSCGVIAHVLLCGTLPFVASTRAHLDGMISRGVVNFDTYEWVQVSPGAADFVAMLLRKSPKSRGLPSQALGHDWIVSNMPKCAKARLPASVLDNLRKFHTYNRLKRAAMHVIASMLPETDTREARKAFNVLDSDGDGQFTIQELKDSLRKNRFEKVGSGTIDVNKTWPEDEQDGFAYTEFLAATFNYQKALRDGLCRAAFSSFDKNHDGSISISELATGKMLGHLALDEVSSTLEALDVDGNANIDYEEFMQMMQDGT